MGDHLQIFIATVRVVAAGALIFVILMLLSLIGSTVQTDRAASATDAPSSGFSLGTVGSANIISDGAAQLVTNVGSAANATLTTIQTGVQAAASAVVRGAHAIQTGSIAAARGVGSAVMFVGNGIGAGIVFVLHIPGNVATFVSNTAVVSAVIKPADDMEVPVIDPNSPELKAAVAALPPTDTALVLPTEDGTGPVWPIRGTVTTEFGVPHRPYQHTHTGLDISDGKRAGTTPIKPFRPGVVTEAVRSNKGLGNHVVVDHGNGVTSVYGHLHSISVEPGQTVSLGTTLGFEGTTGVSTGTHLHFEIRVNGQAADPRHFISGHP